MCKPGSDYAAYGLWAAHGVYDGVDCCGDDDGDDDDVWMKVKVKEARFEHRLRPQNLEICRRSRPAATINFCRTIRSVITRVNCTAAVSSRLTVFIIYN